MSLEKKLFTLISNSREDARKQVTELFLEEHFGAGKGDNCSKYEYTVEKYSMYSVVLKRPANLNKGFDFTVNIDGMYFKSDKGRKHTNPSHSDIISSLLYVKNNLTEKEYSKIKEIIQHIFRLEEYNLDSVANLYFLDFENKERPIAIILLAIRWLFIEQDITYWNWSGRCMLMNALLAKGLV